MKTSGASQLRCKHVLPDQRCSSGSGKPGINYILSPAASPVLVQSRGTTSLPALLQEGKAGEMLAPSVGFGLEEAESGLTFGFLSWLCAFLLVLKHKLSPAQRSCRRRKTHPSQRKEAAPAAD